MAKQQRHFVLITGRVGIRGKSAGKGQVWEVSKAEKLNLLRRNKAEHVDESRVTFGSQTLEDGPVGYEPGTEVENDLDDDDDEDEGDGDEFDTTVELNGETIDLKPKTVKELKAMAKSLGLTGYSAKNEDELIIMIQKAVAAL